VGGVERWHLPSIEANGKREPRVLFSRPECRAVVIDLNEGDELGDHRVYESAVLQVVSGRLRVGIDGREVECDAGSLAVFAPRETHSVRALEASRILLLLAPWPGDGHFPDGEAADPERMPVNSVAPPLD
jgi:quercetin dioxygenase-like cupin family protein